MKLVYFDFDGKKEFELPIDVLASIDDEYIVKDVLPWMNQIH